MCQYCMGVGETHKMPVWVKSCLREVAYAPVQELRAVMQLALESLLPLGTLTMLPIMVRAVGSGKIKVQGVKVRSTAAL